MKNKRNSNLKKNKSCVSDAVPSDFIALLGTPGCIWVLLGTFWYYLVLLEIYFGTFWVLLGTLWNFWVNVGTFGQFRILWVTLSTFGYL